MKISKFDAVFSKLVRERANWTCEVCNTYYPEGNRRGIECSHFFTRSRQGTRLHPQNAACHCTKCHFNFGGNPIEFSRWIKDHLGEQLAYDIEQLSHRIKKKTKAYREEEYLHLKAELARMEELRRQGVRGRIEFTAYE